MKRVAIILHADETIAPVDDNANHFDKIELFEADENNDEAVDLPFDPQAEDFELSKALTQFDITHVIGQHFEEKCFKKLQEHDIRMWLEAPEFTARQAIAAWKKGELPEARVGAHAMHGPEGKRTRHESTYERHPRRARGSSDVSSPIHGPEI